MSEEAIFYEFQNARSKLRNALEEFWKKTENSERALIDEFNELLEESDGWDDLVIVEK